MPTIFIAAAAACRPPPLEDSEIDGHFQNLLDRQHGQFHLVAALAAAPRPAYRRSALCRIRPAAIRSGKTTRTPGGKLPRTFRSSGAGRPIFNGNRLLAGFAPGHAQLRPVGAEHVLERIQRRPGVRGRKRSAAIRSACIRRGFHRTERRLNRSIRRPARPKMHEPVAVPPMPLAAYRNIERLESHHGMGIWHVTTARANLKSSANSMLLMSNPKIRLFVML